MAFSQGYYCFFQYPQPYMMGEIHQNPPSDFNNLLELFTEKLSIIGI
jgi:hypothetical protein